MLYIKYTSSYNFLTQPIFFSVIQNHQIIFSDNHHYRWYKKSVSESSASTEINAFTMWIAHHSPVDLNFQSNIWNLEPLTLIKQMGSPATGLNSVWWRENIALGQLIIYAVIWDLNSGKTGRFRRINNLYGIELSYLFAEYIYIYIYIHNRCSFLNNC